VRDLIDRILSQVEEKENAIYEQAEELGVTKLYRHGAEKSFFDYFSGTHGSNTTFSNISTI